MSKRKARSQPEAAVEAVGGGGDDRPASLLLSSIDLLNSKTTPKIVAEALLLALLPRGATKHDAAAKTLLKAFPLITAELEARTSALTRKTESEGTRLPIAFHFIPSAAANDGESSVVIHIPEECFIKMFSFLNGKEVVNVSTVNKVWLSISRKPELWNRLDRKNGLSWLKAKRLNVTSLSTLLGRPQFTNLKHLQLPPKCKVGKNKLRSISRACPNLETFDMGESRGSDSDLLNAAEIFSNLTGLHFRLHYDITNNGIMSAVRMMGTQLLDLSIHPPHGYGLSKYLSDESVGVIAEFCPNLKHFDYTTGQSVHCAVRRDLSANGITCLIRKCRRLEVLELGFVHAISGDDFAAILSMLEHEDNKRHALRKIHLRGYPFVIGDKPFTITENLNTRVYDDKIYFN